jgi:hypothetical protein
MSPVVEMRQESQSRGTSEFRYAFQIKCLEDMPEDFQEEYQKSCDTNGIPLVAFFSPAICWQTARSVVDAPPKVLLLFPDAVHMITATKSRGAVLLEVARSRLLAYGIAEFVLDCWFTLYYGPEASATTIIPFPARAAGFYRGLSRRLWAWSSQNKEQCFVRPAPLGFFLSGRFPRKFSHFLQNHPEIRLRPQSFLQPALVMSKSHHPFWPNLLLGLTDDKLVVLCDQYDGYPSKCGLEATILPLRTVKRITWIDRRILRQARIAIDVERHGRSLRFSWPTSPRLRTAAMNWIERATVSLSLASQQERDLHQPAAMSTLVEMSGYANRQALLPEKLELK